MGIEFLEESILVRTLRRSVDYFVPSSKNFLDYRFTVSFLVEFDFSIDFTVFFIVLINWFLLLVGWVVELLADDQHKGEIELGGIALVIVFELVVLLSHYVFYLVRIEGLVPSPHLLDELLKQDSQF